MAKTLVPPDPFVSGIRRTPAGASGRNVAESRRDRNPIGQLELILAPFSFLFQFERLGLRFPAPVKCDLQADDDRAHRYGDKVHTDGLACSLRHRAKK
ncbi:hypothetical protein EVAR_34268_1 [Eumeta japonica]|uniref:Uncharacterized protein n=1 Tax=Eumeta variegata TaxID=151549 RepID=A0A4C1VYE3_EUMVA|nr:hypothetical protein EVAR_34268_1 [Eumeta japonica]